MAQLEVPSEWRVVMGSAWLASSMAAKRCSDFLVGVVCAFWQGESQFAVREIWGVGQ